MATVDETSALLAKALELGLSGAVHCESIPLEDLAAMYNGIGPESIHVKWLSEATCKKISEKVRATLSKKLATYAAATLIHDVRFAESDGTTRGFNYANDELEANNLIIADAKYAWYNPLRIFARRVGVKVADVCRVVGWSAWIDAYKAKAKKGISLE
jgi:hypothetical protein